MSNPNLHFREMEETGFYNTVLADIAIYHERIMCIIEETECNKLCDEILENIEREYKRGYFTEEQVRYLTFKLLQDS